MKYFSMFSGIGGFEEGIRRATNDAWTCVGYSEIDKYAIQTYEKHFKHKNYGDATKIKPEELPDFDILCGGFPCQSFSIAGKRKGFQDTRGTLFYEICRIVAVKRPRLLFLENVKGLLSADNGRCFATIISSLDELGYDVEWQILNSIYFTGQNRERVYIIGHLRKETPTRSVLPISCKHKIHVKSSFQSWKKNVTCITTRSPKARSNIDATYIVDRKGIRAPIPEEYERLQGFPTGYTIGVSETQRYKQLGNAVTTNVIKTIVEKISF